MTIESSSMKDKNLRLEHISQVKVNQEVIEEVAKVKGQNIPESSATSSSDLSVKKREIKISNRQKCYKH